MSIRYALLALLGMAPRYGSQLHREFMSRTGSTWPLNVGQVYSTLARFERDGLAVSDGEDSAGHALYGITDAGREELHSWCERPVDRTSPPRDELAIKLAMAIGSSGVDVRAVVQGQRHHTVKAMQDCMRLKAQIAAEEGEDAEGIGGPGGRLARLLVLDQMIFRVAAELQWLHHCEMRLARLAPSLTDPSPQASPVRLRP